MDCLATPELPPRRALAHSLVLLDNGALLAIHDLAVNSDIVVRVLLVAQVVVCQEERADHWDERNAQGCRPEVEHGFSKAGKVSPLFVGYACIERGSDSLVGPDGTLTDGAIVSIRTDVRLPKAIR